MKIKWTTAEITAWIDKTSYGYNWVARITILKICEGTLVQEGISSTKAKAKAKWESLARANGWQWRWI